MTNSLDTNTQNTLPTSFRIIGFGAESIPMIDAIQRLDYDGVSAEIADNAKEPGPAFREDFDRYPILKTEMETSLQHLKA